jgi:ATP:cob(I)alamin adenosyltransferase
MAKIYTKRGDKGYTSLYGGRQVSKSSQRVEAYGTVDEANAALGLACQHIRNELISTLLRLCQKKLFILSSELASDASGRRQLDKTITADDVEALEEAIDAFSVAVSENHSFIVPGLSLASAHLHVARTAVRRAERRVVEINAFDRSNPQIIIFLNRLSDLMFVLSRVVDESERFRSD